MSGYLWVLPLILAFFLPCTCIISYVIAVQLKHVDSGFPYISDTGSEVPERCIFGQLMNVYAMLVTVFMYVRFSQVREHYRITEELIAHTGTRRNKLIANKVALVVGMLGALGTSIVGNFQKNAIIEVHVVGAFMAFGLGGAYAWIQSVLAYSIPSMNGSSKICQHLRFIFTVTYTILFTIMIIYTNLSIQLFNGDMKHWGPDEPGYKEHLVATSTEWSLAVLLSVFFATFIPEFRRIGLKCQVVHLLPENGNHDNSEDLI